MKDFIKAIHMSGRREGEMAIGTSGRTPAAQSRSSSQITEALTASSVS